MASQHKYPSLITEKLKIAKSAKSELAKKLVILADSDNKNMQYAALADELSETRNLIVHDKPFEFTVHQNGEVEVRYFRSRGENEKKKYRYEDLTDFYKKCDEVKNYVASISPVDIIGFDEISFARLVNG